LAALHCLQVVALTAKCGESSTAATQLQVVKALLTYVTGEGRRGMQRDIGGESGDAVVLPVLLSCVCVLG